MSGERRRQEEEYSDDVEPAEHEDDWDELLEGCNLVPGYSQFGWDDDVAGYVAPFSIITMEADMGETTPEEWAKFLAKLAEDDK
jgi:hypothetical protein